MALIKEDGTIVQNANTWVERSEYIARAASRGIVIADDEKADAELIKAADFINEHEARLKGNRVDRDQSMSFPREGVTIDGWEWGKSEIPRQVLLCQLALALDVHAGIDLHNPPQSQSAPVKRRKIEGAVEVEFAVADAPGKLSRKSTANALLRSLMRKSGLQMVRA